MYSAWKPLRVAGRPQQPLRAAYMRLGLTCSSRLKLRCERLHPSPYTSRHREPGYRDIQRRVLLTSSFASRSSIAPHLQQRAYQWSQIAHKSAPLGASETMAVGKQVNAAQTRGHMGHSHGHGHHHHDNTFLTSTNKSDPGVRITRVGLYVNLGMAIAKGAGGYMFNSKA